MVVPSLKTATTLKRNIMLSTLSKRRPSCRNARSVAIPLVLLLASKVKGSKPKSTPAAMSKAVKNLVTRQVAKLTKTKKADDDASDTSDSTTDTPVTGNRTSKALARKAKK